MEIIEATKAPFITPSGILLPSHDSYGQLHGAGYRPVHKARKSRRSTRSTFVGPKTRRRYEALAQTEFKLLTIFAFNPYIVDIREQYSVYKQEAFNRAMREGRRMPIKDRMTIDIIVTMINPVDGRLHYHGISIKAPGKVLTKEETARHQREEAALAERGWTWEWLRSDAFTDVHYFNCFWMYRTIREEDDVLAQYDVASEFAEYLLTRSTKGILSSVMTRVGNQLGISVHRAHELFCIAVSFGMLRVDHTKPLRPNAELHLLS